MSVYNNNNLFCALERQSPDIIINTAAYTNVVMAEQCPDDAFQINAHAVDIMAKWAEENNALFIHYSTDYVFDGNKKAPYQEGDRPNPTNIYGASKYLGEKHVIRRGGNFAIIRTSWVFDKNGVNFLNIILKKLLNGEQVKVVNDQIGHPTYAPFIADATLQILEKMCPFQQNNEKNGIYHLSGEGGISWHQFACQAFFEAGRRLEVNNIDKEIKEKIIPISTDEWNELCKNGGKEIIMRPKNSLLDNQKLQKNFAITMPPWQRGVMEFVDGFSCNDNRG